MCIILNEVHTRDEYFIIRWIVDEVFVIIGRPSWMERYPFSPEEAKERSPKFRSTSSLTRWGQMNARDSSAKARIPEIEHLERLARVMRLRREETMLQQLEDGRSEEDYARDETHDHFANVLEGVLGTLWIVYDEAKRERRGRRQSSRTLSTLVSTNLYAALSELPDTSTSVTGPILDLRRIHSNRNLAERPKSPAPGSNVDTALSLIHI